MQAASHVFHMYCIQFVEK